MWNNLILITIGGTIISIICFLSLLGILTYPIYYIGYMPLELIFEVAMIGSFLFGLAGALIGFFIGTLR